MPSLEITSADTLSIRHFVGKGANYPILDKSIFLRFENTVLYLTARKIRVPATQFFLLSKIQV